MKAEKRSSQKARQRRALLLLTLITVLLALIIQFLPQRSVSPERERSEGQAESGQTFRGGAPIRKAPEREELVRLAFVIDDAGYNLEDLEPFLECPARLTIAVLPHLPDSKEAARRTVAAGKEVILHLPMEPIGDSDPGPGAITLSHDRSEIRDLLDKSFESVPGALGLNNHMGSKATTDERVLGIIMEYLLEKNGFFLDSITTSQTRVSEVAESYNVRHLARTVFLDNVVTEEAIEESFAEGLRAAVKNGSAILIGHVKNLEILTLLSRIYPTFTERGIKAVTLSELFNYTDRGIVIESTGD